MMSSMSMVSALVFYAFKHIYALGHASILGLFGVFAAICTPLLLPAPLAVITRKSKFIFPHQAIRSVVFWCSVLCVTTNLLQTVFYLSTVYNQALWITGGNQQLADTLSGHFAWMFPVFGVLSTPLNGLLLVKMPIISWSASMGVLAVIFGIFICLPVYAVQVHDMKMLL